MRPCLKGNSTARWSGGETSSLPDERRRYPTRVTRVLQPCHEEELGTSPPPLVDFIETHLDKDPTIESLTKETRQNPFSSPALQGGDRDVAASLRHDPQGREARC